MTLDALDPLIHVPARLQIVATLAALPEGDALSFPRLQEMIGLTPGNLITHLRKLEDAGYVTTVKSGSGVNARTSVSLSRPGRQALDNYMSVLRQLLDSASANGTSQHQPGPANPDRISPGQPPGPPVRRSDDEAVF